MYTQNWLINMVRKFQVTLHSHLYGYHSVKSYSKPHTMLHCTTYTYFETKAFSMSLWCLLGVLCSYFVIIITITTTLSILPVLWTSMTYWTPSPLTISPLAWTSFTSILNGMFISLYAKIKRQQCTEADPSDGSTGSVKHSDGVITWFFLYWFVLLPYWIATSQGHYIPLLSIHRHIPVSIIYGVTWLHVDLLK